jgi:cyclopropane-fatty-acyl-phospholipid synthase
MSLIASAIQMVERAPLPDAVARLGIAYLVGRSRRRFTGDRDGNERTFAQDMDRHIIAEHADLANAQHYELPPEFFRLALGPRRKYSCCLYDSPSSSLGEAEIRALDETMAHADLADGQDILELGCGWGSLTLAMAERFPKARITAISNSRPQAASIIGEAATRNLTNVRVLTADMNDYAPQEQYDRIVSVEMFEHMANWRALLTKVRSWLRQDGRLFIHVFAHRDSPYRFDHTDRTDWIAQHFFTGGIMPSHGLMRRFPDLFEVEKDWRWSGAHYERTARDWLAKFDANIEEIDIILAKIYGSDAAIWRRRWRLFFLATAGLFGDSGGLEWGVSHYRLRPAIG